MVKFVFEMKRDQDMLVKNQTGRMNKKWLLFLITASIFIITGFQGYWLLFNYQKERSALRLQARVAFSETVRQLQAKKLKLDKYFNDSAGNFQSYIANKRPLRNRTVMIQDEMAGFINDISIHVIDSIKGDKEKIEYGEIRSIRLDSEIGRAHV